MTTIETSRRSIFQVGAAALAAVAAIPEIADAQTDKGLGAESEKIIREHYKTWEDKDWQAEDLLLADDFTFSSAAGDNHISKSAFKKQCWDTQANHIKRFDLVRIFGGGNEAFVMYDCRTMNDKTFRKWNTFSLGAER